MKAYLFQLDWYEYNRELNLVLNKLEKNRVEIFLKIVTTMIMYVEYKMAKNV